MPTKERLGKKTFCGSKGEGGEPEGCTLLPPTQEESHRGGRAAQRERAEPRDERTHDLGTSFKILDQAGPEARDPLGFG